MICLPTTSAWVCSPAKHMLQKYLEEVHTSQLGIGLVRGRAPLLWSAPCCRAEL